MKKSKYIILYLLMLISLIITAVSLVFMPDKVPTHYNIAGQIDHYGTKYLYLLFPCVTIAMGVFFLFIARCNRKKEDHVGEKVAIWTAILTLILFNVISILFLYNTMPFSNEVDVIKILYKISAIGLGAILIIVGGILPQLKRNMLTGFRTKWNIKNERVWQKSQQFGVVIAITCGLCMMIVGILFDGFYVILFSVLLLILNTVISYFATYIIYKNNK